MTCLTSPGSAFILRRFAKITIAIAGLTAFMVLGTETKMVGKAGAGPLCEADGIPIQITIEKVRNSRGTIKVELYDGTAKNNGKKRKKVARTRVKAQSGETRLCLNAPSQGEYAIALYHDENDNKKLDRNFIGIPREGFGFSNNPPVRLGLPAQEEMRFRVDYSTAAIRISVVYL